MESTTIEGMRYEWLGQSTMRITTGSGRVIYTDPVFLDPEPPRADLILITHHHVDHCLPEFVSQVRDDDTWLGAFYDAYIKHCAQDITGKRVRTIRIGETRDFEGIKVTAVEAYAPRGFHMKGEGCGFIIDVEGRRIYFAGDTSRTDEMAGLGEVDVAILPIADNTGIIKAADMAEAARTIDPKAVIPVHYTPPEEPSPVPKEGQLSTKDPRFFTTKVDPEKFASLLEGTGIDVVILKKLTPPAEE